MEITWNYHGVLGYLDYTGIIMFMGVFGLSTVSPTNKSIATRDGTSPHILPHICPNNPMSRVPIEILIAGLNHILKARRNLGYLCAVYSLCPVYMHGQVSIRNATVTGIPYYMEGWKIAMLTTQSLRFLNSTGRICSRINQRVTRIASSLPQIEVGDILEARGGCLQCHNQHQGYHRCSAAGMYMHNHITMFIHLDLMFFFVYFISLY